MARSTTKTTLKGDVAASFSDEANRTDVGARPRSEITGKHDEGSGANETIDGLDEMAESVRHNAEDIPTGTVDTLEDLPVFDRAAAEPKI